RRPPETGSARVGLSPVREHRARGDLERTGIRDPLLPQGNRGERLPHRRDTRLPRRLPGAVLGMAVDARVRLGHRAPLGAPRLAYALTGASGEGNEREARDPNMDT